MKRILVLLAAITFVGVAAAAAAWPAAPPASAGFMGFDGYLEEYRQAVADLDMPPGTSLPSDRERPSEQTSYQRGSGLVEAQGLWLCAWEQEWLAQRAADTQRADRALAELNGAASMEYVTTYLDQAGKDLFERALEGATNGDPDAMVLDATVNCGD